MLANPCAAAIRQKFAELIRSKKKIVNSDKINQDERARRADTTRIVKSFALYEAARRLMRSNLSLPKPLARHCLCATNLSPTSYAF